LGCKKREVKKIRNLREKNIPKLWGKCKIRKNPLRENGGKED